MKKIVIVIIGFLMIVPSVFANELNPRKGFFIGFSLGGGVLDATGIDADGAFLGSLRIGGGLNEKLLLMGETSNAVISNNGVNTGLYSVNFSAQYFVMDTGLFVRPGVGLSYTNTESSSGNVTVITSNDEAGLSLIGATGYEFRLGRSFCLTPEFNYGFARIDGVNFNRFGLSASFMFYFK
ncbi:MAG: outer membrane beta-barrel protein [Bdellovibrionales bacterium]|nr:outer membrane beta-barrel protein [Bdellovibrionales bacterium]